MSIIYSNTNGNIYPKNNYYLLSSWNYGSYSPSNPFYKYQIYSKKEKITTNPNIMPDRKSFPRSTTTTQLTSSNPIIPFYPVTKRYLKEEERIVTNELLDCYNHYIKMEKHLKKGTFRPKSVNRIMNSKKNKEEENNSKISKKSRKSDTSKYKYKLSFTEWLSVKNKQRAIFNEIIKKQKEEEEFTEEANKRIDSKYQEIKEQKYKEWVTKKHIELIIRKQLEKQKKLKIEEEKKEKEEKKEDIMNRWFKVQAQKMEKEMKEKKEKIMNQQKQEYLKKIEKKQKEILNRKAFREWKEKKEIEIKKRKYEERKQKEKEEEKRKRDYLKKKVKSFTIGPYTDAAALKEVQNCIVENNLNKEEEYYLNNSDYEGRK